jgi:hypothetical protein
MVDEYIRAPAHGNPTRYFIDSDRLEGLSIVYVDGLQERLRSAEDNESVAGDVCLARPQRTQRISD